MNSVSGKDGRAKNAGTGRRGVLEERRQELFSVIIEYEYMPYFHACEVPYNRIRVCIRIVIK